MTVRTFWAILLKVAGLSLLAAAVGVIGNLAATLSMMADWRGVTGIISIVAVVIIYLICLWLCLFRTDWIIDTLRLDKSFGESERIELNVSPLTVVQIAVTVVGAIMVIDSLPAFCRQSFVFFQEKSVWFHESPDAGWIIFHAVKIVLGAILALNGKKVAGLICK